LDDFFTFVGVGTVKGLKVKRLEIVS